MAARAKIQQGTYRREYRHRLHEAVDRLLDGPDWGDVDKWARQALVDLGLFVRVAAAALDYEVGRIISGVGRRHGNFPSNLSWEGAELSVKPQQAKAWMAAGEAARPERPTSELQQQALAALLHPIANVSRHTWLHDLAHALDAFTVRRGKAAVGTFRPWPLGCWERAERMGSTVAGVVLDRVPGRCR